YLLEPAPPLVMHTVTTSQPARAHLARVPPTVNSWSSGCAWMLIARLGAGGSFGGVLAGTGASLTAERVVGHARHPPDQRVGGGEAGGAVGQRGRYVLGVGGQDEERPVR